MSKKAMVRTMNHRWGITAVTIFGSLCLVPLAGLAAGKKLSPHPGATAATGMTKTVTLPVLGMSCASCVANVKRNLKGMGGVEEAHVNLGERSARIKYDPRKVTSKRLRAKIEELGYKSGPPMVSKK